MFRTRGGGGPADASRRSGGHGPSVHPAWSFLLALACFALYAWMTPRVTTDGDAGELTLVLATNGAAHPTGYPIYTLLGYAFVTDLHALGVSLEFAANLWSALGGAVAMYFCHRLALRMVSDGAPPGAGARAALAALPLALLALNPVWTRACTGTEVYSWQLAWVLGTALYFAALIQRLDSEGPGFRGLPAAMAGWGFLCGVGAAHHATSLFFAVGLTAGLWLALGRARQLRPWVPLVWALAAVVPLLSYLCLYYRAAHPGEATTWPMLEPGLRGLWNHVSARTYQRNLGQWHPSESDVAELRTRIYPFLWPGLALGAGLAAWRAPWRRRVLLGALLGSAAAQLVFIYHYGIYDPSPYFLPPLAVGLLALTPALAELHARLRPSRWVVLPACAAVLLAISLLAVPWVRAGRERKALHERVDNFLEMMWLKIPFRHAIVFWPNDSYMKLREFQVLRGEHPDLEVYHTALLTNPRPREEFRRLHGFDPLCNNDREHLARPLRPEFVIGRQTSAEQAHRFALIHETVADSAGVPVIAFEPPSMRRILRTRPGGP